jgi:hypothetical protein
MRKFGRPIVQLQEKNHDCSKSPAIHSVRRIRPAGRTPSTALYICHGGLNDREFNSEEFMKNH